MDLEKLAAILEAVQVLPLRPTDVVVFRTPANLPADACASIYDYLADRLGTKRILVLVGGATLEVVRPEGEPAAEAAPEAPAKLDPIAAHRARVLSGG